MRYLLAGVVGLFGLAGTAHAADVPVRPYYKAPPPAPVFNWTGFYAGLHGGYGWGDSEIAGLPFNTDGWFGGVQAGYNWQFSPNWVFGVEADIAYSNIDGANVLGPAAGELRYFGTLRARFGYTWDRSLLYVTGGGAYGEQRIGVPGGTDSQTHFGYTLGAGYEWAFAPNWSAKIEYLFTDLNSENYNPGGVTVPAALDFSTVKLGVNYRF
jgi:outer membrane immunogenic protein